MDAGAVRGHLEGMILAVLEQGPSHGYGVIELLKQRSGGALDLPSGTVYPALRRLERNGFVSGEWSSVGGRERRTYQLTGRGRKELAAHRTSWSKDASVIASVLGIRGI